MIDDWLTDLVELLGPEDAGEWLSAPMEAPDTVAGVSPLELVLEGRQDEVADIVRQMTN